MAPLQYLFLVIHSFLPLRVVYPSKLLEWSARILVECLTSIEHICFASVIPAQQCASASLSLKSLLGQRIPEEDYFWI